MNRLRPAVGVVVLVAVVVVVAVVAGGTTGEGRPLDPSSTGRLGARALVLLLERFGATVTVSDAVPVSGGERAVVLVDRLNDDQRGRLDRWVRAGGVLIVADPDSALSARRPRGLPLLDSGLSPTVERGHCDVPALADVGEVEPHGGVLLDVAAGDRSCFGDTGAAYVVQRTAGSGSVVEIGGPGAFTNDALDQVDNAALAAALMAPGDSARVTIIDGAPAGAGDESLWDLIPWGVRLVGLQVVLAFVLVVLWRSRRLGAPVHEVMPVNVASSELVAATARLWQRADGSRHAAAYLRGELRHQMATRGDIPLELAPEVAAGLVAERTGLPIEMARVAVVAGSDDDPGELPALVAIMEEIRRELFEPEAVTGASS